MRMANFQLALGRSWESSHSRSLPFLNYLKRAGVNDYKRMGPANAILLTADIFVRTELTKLGCVCPKSNLKM